VRTAAASATVHWPNTNITHCGSLRFYDSRDNMPGQAESMIKRHKGPNALSLYR
jgi:hypothetical protein